MNVIYKI